MALYIGIDIGGTKIAGALVTEAGQVVGRATRPTPAREGGARVLETALDVARSLATPEVWGEVCGVGVGTGGQIDAARGVVVSATGLLPGWAGTPVRGALEEALQRPVFVTTT